MSYDGKLEIKILEWCDKHLGEIAEIEAINIPIKGYNQYEIRNHAEILCEGGFIKYRIGDKKLPNSGIYDPVYTEEPIYIQRLTYQGTLYLKTKKLEFRNKLLYILGLIGVYFLKDAMTYIFNLIIAKP